MFHPDYGSQGWIETRNNLIGLWTFWVLIFMCQKFSFLLFIVHCWASSKAKKKTNREFGELKGIKYYLLSFITFHSRAIFITNFNFASYKITFFFYVACVAVTWWRISTFATRTVRTALVKWAGSEREREWERKTVRKLVKNVSYGRWLWVVEKAANKSMGKKNAE